MSLYQSIIFRSIEDGFQVMSQKGNSIIRTAIVFGIITLAVKALTTWHKTGGDWVGGLDYTLVFKTVEAIDMDERPIAQRKRDRYASLRAKQGFLTAAVGRSK